MKSVAHEAVYNQIMAAFDKGIIPWRKSWTQSMPRNAISNTSYSGVNFFLLSMTYHTDPRWLTWNQANKLGGQVRKGEKSMAVIFWKINTIEKNGKKESFPLLRYYNVFNVDQVDGVDFGTVESNKYELNHDAESIIAGYNGPKIEFGGSQPCYILSQDKVIIPPIEKFSTADEYYATMFHELIHSVAHESRLNRHTNCKFGFDVYSEDELEAEFGSAFLCNIAGIDNTIENSTAYIQSWAKVFNNDPSILVRAASKAQKSADFILGINQKEESTV